MRHFIYLFVISVAIALISCTSFKKGIRDNSSVLNERNHIRFMFYNVENLFDTLDSPNTRDEEFLPEGDKRWTSYRYYDKLQKISKVVIAVGGWHPPEIIGLCEIENRNVLNDLIRLTPLKEFDYDIIHKESPDFRGIDNALLFRRDKFQPLFYDFYKINFPLSPNLTTREILYVKGLLDQLDTIHIFINHFPSRRGGKEASEPKRIFVANILKNKIDSIVRINSNSKIIISGDFNDEPTDKSIAEILNAGLDSVNYTNLFNLMSQAGNNGEGSYKYGFEWNVLDQIIVSRSLLESTGYTSSYTSAKIFKEEWMMYEDKKYKSFKPNRTYLGPRYLGGYSDHLPVYFDLKLIK